jgi:hypothetical protein
MPLENLQKDVLYEVLALGGMSSDLQTELIDAPVVPFKQRCETGRVAVSDPFDQLFVCHSSHTSNDDRRAKTLPNSAEFRGFMPANYPGCSGMRRLFADSLKLIHCLDDGRQRLTVTAKPVVVDTPDSCAAEK